MLCLLWASVLAGFGCTLAVCSGILLASTLAPHRLHVIQPPMAASMSSFTTSSTVNPLTLPRSPPLLGISYLTVSEYKSLLGMKTRVANKSQRFDCSITLHAGARDCNFVNIDRRGFYIPRAMFLYRKMAASERNTKLISEICGLIESRAKYYSSALVKLALVLHEGTYSLHSAVITFAKDDEQVEDEKRDYGSLVLIQKLLEPKRICLALKELAENMALIIEGLPEFDIEGSFDQLRFVPSQSRFGYLKSNWATRCLGYRMGRTASLPIDLLVSPDLPLYPDGNRAVIDFLNLRTNSAPNIILVQIPDYRVRIIDLNISGYKIKLKIEANNISSDELIAKFYAEYDSRSRYIGDRGFMATHSPNLHFKDNFVEYEFEREFNYFQAVVLSAKTGEKLDYREYYFKWPVQEGITIELEELEIREIISRGEDLNVEFKQDLSNTEEFLETVVAFANSKGGRIFLGVADDTRIIGFQPKSEDQITNLITSNIEPALKFDESTLEIDGKNITLIEIPEGDDKPYSHRQLGVYVRSGATDRRATRTDWDRFSREKSS